MWRVVGWGWPFSVKQQYGNNTAPARQIQRSLHCKLNILVTMAGITKWLGHTIHNIHSHNWFKFEDLTPTGLDSGQGGMYIWRLLWGGGRGLAKFWPKEGRLREFGTDKGREGVQNPENLADVICTSSPMASISVPGLVRFVELHPVKEKGWTYHSV